MVGFRRGCPELREIPVFLGRSRPVVWKDSGVCFGFLSRESDVKRVGGEGGIVDHEEGGENSGEARGLREVFLLSEREKTAAGVFVVDEETDV